MYKRKTMDEYEVQIYTGTQYKWEIATIEMSRLEAKVQAKIYRQEQHCAIRIVKKRVPLTSGV